MSERLSHASMRGLAWQYASFAFQGVASFFVMVVLSRLLDSHAFGLMSICLIFTGLADLFAQLGISQALVQRQDLSDTHLRVGTYLSLVMGGALFAILFIASTAIGAFFGEPALVKMVQVLSFSLLIQSIAIVPEAQLVRRLDFRKIMIRDSVSYAIGYLGVGITLAMSGFGVWSIVAASTTQTILKAVLICAAQPPVKKPIYRKLEALQLLNFGIGFSLARMFNYAANKGDYFVIGRLAEVSQVGIYSRAYTLMALPATYIGAALEKVVFPAMAKAASDSSRISRMFLIGTSCVALLALPITALCAVTAEELISVILGNKWQGAIPIFQIMCFVIYFRTAYKLGDAVAKATGKVYARSVREAVYAALVISGSVIGLVLDSVRGVAVGVFFAIIVNFLLTAAFTLRALGISWRTYALVHLPGVLFGLVVGVSAFIAHSICDASHLPQWVSLASSWFVGSVAPLGLALLRPSLIGEHASTSFARMSEMLPPKSPFLHLVRRLAGNPLRYSSDCETK